MKWLCLCAIFIFAQPVRAEDELAIFKRGVLRDCKAAEDVAPKLNDTQLSEAIPYLGAIFKMMISSQNFGAAAAMQPSDPSEIWRSVSGEIERDAKMCAIGLIGQLGPRAMPALVNALPLLGDVKIDSELKERIRILTERYIRGAKPGEIPAEILKKLVELTQSSKSPYERLLIQALPVEREQVATVAPNYAWLRATPGELEQPVALDSLPPEVAHVLGATPTRALEKDKERKLKALTPFLQGRVTENTLVVFRLFLQYSVKPHSALRMLLKNPERTTQQLAALALIALGQPGSALAKQVKLAPLLLDCRLFAQTLPLAAADTKPFDDSLRAKITECLAVTTDHALLRRLVMQAAQLQMQIDAPPPQSSLTEAQVAALSMKLLKDPQKLPETSVVAK